jgi:uncharacterized protein YndB with AHSA1/START domain
MPPKPEPACLVIADISGYTGYLAGVELDHAQDILADLIDTIVSALRPPFHLSKLEGDAAFVYVPTPTVDCSLLQDTIEAAYCKFRQRLRDIRQASTCECDACRQIPTLDLKFIIHHGQIAKQAISGHEELIGRDVILIHRLLKNNAEEKLKRRAYALYTDAVVNTGGLDPQKQGLIDHHEIIDIIGDVRCWLRDLEAVWQAENQRKAIAVAAADSIATFNIDVSAPRQTTWEFLTMPGRRALWTFSSTGVNEAMADGRRGVGTINHCTHGKDVIVEEILDWQPLVSITRRQKIFDTGLSITMTHALSDRADGGTHIEVRVAAPPPEQMQLFGQLAPLFRQSMQESSTALVQQLNHLTAQLRGTETAEPKLPVSTGRYATQPVARLQ